MNKKEEVEIQDKFWETNGRRRRKTIMFSAIDCLKLYGISYFLSSEYVLNYLNKVHKVKFQ